MSKPNEIIEVIGLTLGRVLPDILRNIPPGTPPRELGERTLAMLEDHWRAARASPHGSTRLHQAFIQSMSDGVTHWLHHVDDTSERPH